MRRLFIAASLAVLLAGCATPPPATPLQVKLLAINDFHGNLKPPLGGIRIKDPADATKTVNVPAGGAEHLASAVDELRAKNPNHVFVAAGDLIGASPLLSALFRDEPTIESLSTMGLEITAVGNHEFDKGATELLRMQRGGCGAAEGSCKGPQPFQGARFQYLAASTVVQATGQTLLPAYAIKRFEGVPVAFIGLTLKGTPSIVVPTGVAGLTFRDEAETVNGLLPELQKQGVAAFVVLIHEGGTPCGRLQRMPGHQRRHRRHREETGQGGGRGRQRPHTHRAYNCRIDADRLVTSGDKYGTIVTQIDLTLDRHSGRITSAAAENVIVRTDRFPKNSAQTALIGNYEKLAVPLARRVVGHAGRRPVAPKPMPPASRRSGRWSPTRSWPPRAAPVRRSR